MFWTCHSEGTPSVTKYLKEKAGNRKLLSKKVFANSRRHAHFEDAMLHFKKGNC